MAAANELQGLKIAVAAFVTLTVILAVTTYFLYTAYSRSEAQFESERDKAKSAQEDKAKTLSNYGEFRQIVGIRSEDFEPAKAEANTFFKKLNDRVGTLAAATAAAITKAQQAGIESKDLEEAKARIQSIINSYQSEPNKNLMSALERLAELLEASSLLTTEMATNSVGLRNSLESTTKVTKTAIEIQTKAAADSKADLEAEHAKHEQSRQELLTKVDQLQTDNDKKMTQIANLENQLRQQREELERKLDLANAIIREKTDLLDKSENILDKPDGYVTFVDLERREVHVNINRHQGVRPQLKMTVFDASSPGVPTERPKGNIQIIQVGDQTSIARIDRVVSTINPIRVGDIVYSPAWSPDEPTRFALIGKIDVNRDGKDDREDLKRLIEDGGGRVDYDLPPPGYGKESGKLTARISWYVIDARMPLRELYERKSSDAGIAAQALFEKRRGQVIKEARSEGIRPLELSRLLGYLGYEMNTPIVGRAEAVNGPAMHRLVEARKQPAPLKPGVGANKPATQPTAKSDEGISDMPAKDELKENETPK